MRHDEGAICHRIAEARTSAGLTQQELANTLTMTAGVTVTRRDMRRFERSRVPWEFLGDIARLTNTTRGWLLYGERFEDDPNPQQSVFERPLPAGQLESADGGASAPRRLTATWAIVALALSFLAAVIVLRLSGSIVAALAVLVVVNFVAFSRYLR